MAANNGRGRAGRPADFKYTDTVADKGTLQGILKKQDEILERLNILDAAVAREAALEYNDAFSNTVAADFISNPVADGIEANIAAGLIENPFSGISSVTAVATGVSVTVAASDIGNFTTGDVVYVRSSNRAQFRSITVSGNVLTFGSALAAGATIGDTVAVAVAVDAAGNPPADILPVDLKN